LPPFQRKTYEMFPHGEKGINPAMPGRRHLSKIFTFDRKKERFGDVDDYNPVRKDCESSEHCKFAGTLPGPADPPQEAAVVEGIDRDILFILDVDPTVLGPDIANGLEFRQGDDSRGLFASRDSARTD
jgi:hypothetical protein